MTLGKQNFQLLIKFEKILKLYYNNSRKKREELYNEFLQLFENIVGYISIFRLANAFLDFRLYDNMAYEQGEVK